MEIFINTVLLQDCSLSSMVMENPRDISLVILKFQPFFENCYQKGKLIILLCFWTKNKSGNPTGRCSNPADQQGAEARRELSQASYSWVEQIL